MRSLVVLSFLVIAALAGTCDLCGRPCEFGLCTSATDGCTSCSQFCNEWGCTGPVCSKPTLANPLAAKCSYYCHYDSNCTNECINCASQCHNDTVCINRCVKLTSHTVNHNARTDCNLCNLPCVSDADCSFATGQYPCTKCTYVNFGWPVGDGYLCLPQPAPFNVTHVKKH